MKSSAPWESELTRRALLRHGAAGGMALSAAGLLAACGDGGSSSAPAVKPRKGGTLKVGMVGGGSADSLDPDFSVFNFVDTARLRNLYDYLVQKGPDGTPQLVLAESIEPNSDATAWTIRIHEGVRFHDNRPVTADDVVFSVKRASSSKASTGPLWGPLQRNNIRKLDDRTVELHFDSPYSTFQENMCVVAATAVVPRDFDPKHPIGSGPFKYKSFKAGDQSTFVRNEDYWNGPVYPDGLEIIDIPDNDARVNALLSGQVHMVEGVPAAQVQQVEDSGKKVLIGKGALGLMLCVRVDVAPFKDVRVRQALQLMADRKQMVESVLSGQGVVGNDLMASFEPCGSDIPQRERDVEKAKALLKAAGQENLHTKLTTAPAAPGTVSMCEVFAEQAKDAGVRIDVQRLDSSAFFKNYLQWPFAIEYLSGSSSFMGTAALLFAPGAPYNETHYDNPRFNKLYNEALAIVDADKRCDLIHEMQALFHDDSGYVVWGFANYLDGYSREVSGLKGEPILPLGGCHFDKAFLA